jgi:chromosomal replication initiation ATPase DnaA
MQQLLLTGRESVDFDIESYVVGDNQAALQSLLTIVDRPDILVSPTINTGASIVMLEGGAGVGKTHLLLACHQRSTSMAKHNHRTSFYVDFADSQSSHHGIAQLEQWLLGLDQARGSDSEHGVTANHIDIAQLWVDHVENLNSAQQDVLFRFATYLPIQTQWSMVVASSKKLVEMAWRDDLKTRIAAGLHWQLQPLHDGEKLEVLQHFVAKKQMVVDQDVLIWLVQHTERDMHSLMDWACRIDEISLREQRRITLPFIRELFAVKINTAQTVNKTAVQNR